MSLAHLLVESIPQTLRPLVIITMAVAAVCLFVVNIFLTNSSQKSSSQAASSLDDEPASASRVMVERGRPGRRY